MLWPYGFIVDSIYVFVNIFFVYLAYYVCDTVKSADFSGKFGSISFDIGQIHNILCMLWVSYSFNLGIC